MSLTELANRYGSDKGTIGPSRWWSPVNYTDIYEAYLGSWRDRPLNILEIGLGVKGERWEAEIVHGRNSGAASLKMWHEYFPSARIYGIDINPCSWVDNARISTYVVDQGSHDEIASFLEMIGNVKFDFVVDDGSHRPDHQQVSFSRFFTNVRSGGFYFIEDLMSNGIGDRLVGRMACKAVRNTRSVFRGLVDRGEFSGPHCLTNPAELRSHIASVQFHAPSVRTSIRLRPSWRRPLARVSQYAVGSERLLAIRKM